MPDIPFLPDRDLWTRTVRERDNLAAQLAQVQAEKDEWMRAALAHTKRADDLAAQLAQVQAERDAARIDAHAWYTLGNKAANERDAARAELIGVTGAAERLIKMHTRPDGSIGSDTSMVEGTLLDLRAALRGDPAPAGGEARP